MESKRKLFIYDRREVGILILLGVGVALFAFTLGLHLGKQVNPIAGSPAATEGEPGADHGTEPAGDGGHGASSTNTTAGPVATEGGVAGEPVATATTAAPSRTEISEEVKNVPGAIEDTLDQTLRDEVSQSGVKLATPKPLQLPKETRAALERDDAAVTATKTKTPAPSGPGSTDAANERNAEAGAKSATVDALAESARSAPGARKSRASEFALQTGSYPKREEAASALSLMEAHGVTGEIREVEIPGKGRWFRVLTGKFPSIGEAEKSGRRLRAENKLDEYIVVRSGMSSADRSADR